MMTPEEIQRKIDNNPPLKRFTESEDNRKESKLISMAYLMNSIANSFTEEANDIIAQYGLFHFNIKLYSNRLMQAFDLYHRQINSMIPDNESKINFCEDFEDFKVISEKFMNRYK